MMDEDECTAARYEQNRLTTTLIQEPPMNGSTPKLTRVSPETGSVEVAVLVSHGYGAGWSTWSPEGEALIFDPDIAQAVLSKDYTLAEQIAEQHYPDDYTGGVADLEVHWVPQGARFRITEYDGAESLELLDQIHHYVA